MQSQIVSCSAMSFAVVVMVLLALGISPAAGAVRDYGGWYTQERIANLRANCEKYDWAKGQRNGAAGAADRYMELSDEFLWKLIPGQKLPRAIDVSMNKIDGVQVRPGCLHCGHDIDKYGGYPYNPDILGKPWKLTCPSCGEIFPTNDFAKYYESGIDESGVLDPEKADRSLLFNEEHPDPKDPLHKYGVDDGYGYFDEDGNRFLFIAYYNWKQWGFIRNLVSTFANAYLYTGEQKYARKALVMLDRIADVYPDYDIRPYTKLYYYHSGGHAGKVEANIWECGVVTSLARSVGMVLSGTRDDPELYTFLAEKATQYKIGEKGTRELLVQSLDDGILREGAKAVIAGDARGNQGMHQRAITACAMALDQNPETEQWLDWIFEPGGGGIPGVIVGGIDRDGVGAEAAPGYSMSWGGNIGTVADWLADYDGYIKTDIYRDFPQFNATFNGGWNIVVMGYATPNIGDAGSCGSLGKTAASPAYISRGYKYLKDPMIGLAAYYANSQRAELIGRDIFHADPDWVAKDIAEIAAKVDRNPFEGGHNMTGYGLASLEYGWGKPGIGLWLYYGRNGGHGHQDRLNIGMYYCGISMMPELGYPEFCSNWPKRMYSNRNTISHNTVMVNEIQQSFNWVGHPELFCQFEDFGAVRVDSPEVYEGVEKYQRTLAFVNLGEDQAYAFDVFRVRGGNDHIYSFHGPPGEVTTDGLSLVKQETGSYYGPDVPFKEQTSGKPKHGFSWIANVERDAAPAASFTVDWKAEAGWRGVTERDDIHLRYHCLTATDDVALGDVEPPQNKSGNPRWLRYLLAHRAGEDLVSTFSGVIEPYSDRPAIKSVQRLQIAEAPAGSEPVAVRITLADGTVDYLAASDDDQAVINIEGGLEFAGAIGWLRIRDGQVERAALCRGTKLALDGFAIELAAAGHTGTIARMDKDMEGKGYVWVDCALPTDDALVGQQMIIENDRARNACYTIESVAQEGNLYKVCLGDVSFVRGYLDNKDYSKGFVYNFEAGAAFIIPHVVGVTRKGDYAYAVRATGDVELTVPKPEN